MVYRGKPSKACERCRTRRLKCDLKPTSCTQCLRANSLCSGYRLTSQLRFHHETLTTTQNKVVFSQSSEPRYLPIPITSQAHTAFFTQYISSTCWEILTPYHHPLDAPNSLVLAIEAASLAFLWHQTYSHAALQAARQRYTLALRLTNNMLRSRREAVKDTTLLTTLLFDIFEKITTPSHTYQITNLDPHVGGLNPRTTHLDGALTLVNLRGLENFKDVSQFKILRRLDALCVSTSVTNALSASGIFTTLRKHLESLTTGQGTMAELAISISSTMIDYGRLRRRAFDGTLVGREEFMRISMELERRLTGIEENLPASAKASVKFLDLQEGEGRERVWGIYYHEYAHRNVCATRNMLRVARLNLNECLLDHYSSLENPNGELATEWAAQIRILVEEILACLPSYTTCHNVHKVSPILGGCEHTPRQRTDVYLLLFPMFAAGCVTLNKGVINNKSGVDVREWVVKELRYIASHFGIRNAEVVAGILEGMGRDEGGRLGVWDVYAMLGGCAFNS